MPLVSFLRSQTTFPASIFCPLLSPSCKMTTGPDPFSVGDMYDGMLFCIIPRISLTLLPDLADQIRTMHLDEGQTRALIHFARVLRLTNLHTGPAISSNAAVSSLTSQLAGLSISPSPTDSVTPVSQAPAPPAPTPAPPVPTFSLTLVPMGFAYEKPPSTAAPPYYAITRGLKIGVFAGWLVPSHHSHFPTLLTSFSIQAYDQPSRYRRGWRRLLARRLPPRWLRDRRRCHCLWDRRISHACLV